MGFEEDRDKMIKPYTKEHSAFFGSKVYEKLDGGFYKGIFIGIIFAIITLFFPYFALVLIVYFTASSKYNDTKFWAIQEYLNNYDVLIADLYKENEKLKNEIKELKDEIEELK